MMLRNRKAFTMVELLVVIAVIAILIALILPAVQRARESARMVQCRSNLKQFGIALHNYESQHKCYPPGYIAVENGFPSAHHGTSGAGWALFLLPHVEQSALYEAFDADYSIIHANNAKILEFAPGIFQCPSDTKPKYFEIEDEHAGGVLATLPTANYVGVFGTMELHDCENPPGTAPVTADGICVGDGMFYHNSLVRHGDIRDGTSTTFAIGERRTNAGLGWFSTWVGMVPEGEEAFQRVLGSTDHLPNDPAGHFDDFSSFHEGGTQFLMADGTVKFASSTMDHTVYRALSTIKSGDWFEQEF